MKDIHESSMTRRQFVGSTLASASALLAGCKAPAAENEDYVLETLEEGDSNEDYGIQVQNIYENETAEIKLIAGSDQLYDSGDRVICKKENEEFSVYVEDMDPETGTVKLRREEGC